ncbi:hypothetical protein BDV96DRAFT_596012 [Lophiotrema nucula]|uniref:Ubiquitin 3 binding protein But2 C-terminal domain-containing protein n=1 Tax=Lophiotrema nucula TaxID=690887 RepID=A0A6A5ZLD4_9PLEO|nr:hypothetical protein BDV96DRAFT_596012 [Lophiotrema nucula]
MQYSSALLALFAATGAFAAPTYKGADNTIRVILQDQATETGSQTTLKSGVRDIKTPSTSGPFSTIELKVGADVPNRDEYRCAIWDEAGKPIVATRGANVDITFSDAGKGEWTFRKASKVASIICDPTFKKIDPKENQITVILQDQRTELGTQTTFTAGARQELTPSSPGPYETVEIKVGSVVDPAQRCQVNDKHGKPIVAVRGKNTDTTFSDAKKGEWTFKHRQEVSSIICDPTFVAKPQ